MSIFNFFNKKDNKNDLTNLGSLSIRPEDIYTSANLELQDIIAPSALQILPTALNLGDMIVRSFYVVGYPSILNDNWLTPIINLDRVFNVTININPIDTGKILAQFQKKVAEVQSQISTRESKGMVRDPMLESAYRDLESLRDGLQQAQERMFEVGLYISIYAENETELFKVENEIKGQLDAQMVFLKPATFQQDAGFLSTIAIGVDELKVVQKMNTDPLSSTFPFVSFDLTGNKGILYGINQHNNSLIIFDRFSLENYNSVTFAKSGSGKSFATKLEILRSLMFDTEVIVIDPEREYEYLSDAVGGRYFNISLSSDHHINPFDLPIPTKEETGADVLRQNTINLVGLFRVMLGGLTAEEDSIIDRAITETYALKDITADSNFANIEPPLLSDMAVVLAGMDGADSILRKLEKYTTGSWSGFLNRPSNVDINRKFVVFSIRDMEDELKPVAMYIVTHFIWNEVRKNLRKRLLVVDEAWWMMKNEDTASFLYSIAKRGRKYYLGLSTITQDVEDFLKSPYGRPILTNSSMQLLLKQSPTTIDVLRDAFNLTEAEKYTLLEANIGEGIFFAGLKHVAIKIVSSYTEEQIITSDPAQVLAIQAQKDKNR